MPVTSGRDRWFTAGLVLAVVLCLTCFAPAVAFVVSDLAADDEMYDGLGVFAGLVIAMIALVPTSIVLTAALLARRSSPPASPHPPRWVLLAATVLLLFVAPGLASYVVPSPASSVSTALGVAAIACAVASLVRLRRAGH